MGEVWPGSRGWRISFQEAAICLHRCADMVYVGDIVCVCVCVGHALEEVCLVI